VFSLLYSKRLVVKIKLCIRFMTTELTGCFFNQINDDSKLVKPLTYYVSFIQVYHRPAFIIALISKHFDSFFKEGDGENNLLTTLQSTLCKTIQSWKNAGGLWVVERCNVMANFFYETAGNHGSYIHQLACRRIW